MDWKALAKTMVIGQSQKIPCCGSSPSTYVSQTAHGLRLGPCFRCGVTDWEPHGRRSASEILAARSAVPLSKTFTVPSTAVKISSSTAPLAARLWFLKAGITPEQADEWGARWDTIDDTATRRATNRVIIPVEGGYLSRAVYGERPKWVNFSPASFVHFVANSTSTVVICEDVLSARKLYLSGVNAISALGTSISTATRNEFSKYTDVIGWFDDDAAGDKGFVKLRAAMRLHDGTLSRIKTSKDPKHIHKDQIIQLVQETQ